MGDITTLVLIKAVDSASTAILLSLSKYSDRTTHLSKEYSSLIWVSSSSNITLFIYLHIRHWIRCSNGIFGILDAHQGNGHERDKLHFNDENIYILDIFNKVSTYRSRLDDIIISLLNLVSIYISTNMTSNSVCPFPSSIKDIYPGDWEAR